MEVKSEVFNCCHACPQIKLGPALFVPNGQIGSFGALSRIRSLIRSRADLFDLAASGPAAAGLVSTILFIVGLQFTNSMPKASTSVMCSSCWPSYPHFFRPKLSNR